MSSQKPYENPETLAKLRLTGNDGEKMSYEEMAEELGCSVGTVSLRMKKYDDEISQYSKDDFTPDRITKPHTDSQRDVIRGAVMDTLSNAAEIGHHQRVITDPKHGVRVHVPGNYLEDAIENAEEAVNEYNEVFVGVYIGRVNQRVVDKFKEIDIGLLVCRPGRVVAKFYETDQFETTFR